MIVHKQGLVEIGHVTMLLSAQQSPLTNWSLSKNSTVARGGLLAMVSGLPNKKISSKIRVWSQMGQTVCFSIRVL